MTTHLKVAHSEKGLETLRQMNTTPADWGLTPIKWEKKLYPTMVWVKCQTCDGEGSLYTLEGNTEKLTAKLAAKALGWSDYQVEQASAWRMRNVKELTAHGCHVCPWVRPTRTGREYFWEHTYENGEKRQAFSQCHGEQGYVKELRNVEKMVGTVLWAKGTQFDSRFGDNENNKNYRADGCQLCAKPIPSQRFVPLNGKSPDGTIHGIWAGEDCARKFFGVKAFTPEQVVPREVR